MCTDCASEAEAIAEAIKRGEGLGKAYKLQPCPEAKP